MQYIVYKTTNLTNSKTYIGTHKQKAGFGPYEFDGYLGSGNALKAAVRRDGYDSFVRETLFVFDNRKDCMAKEKEIVTDEVVRDTNNYNLKEGGDGGWDFVNDNGLTYIRTVDTEARRRQTLIERYGVDNAAKMDLPRRLLIERNKKPKAKETIEKQRQTLIRGGKVAGSNNPMYGRSGELAPCYGRTGDKHPMFGKHQSEEAKAKIRAASDRKPKPKVTCPHCGKTGGKPAMMHWHFDACKHKN